MSYAVGVVLLVAGFACFDFGRYYLNQPGRASSRSFMGELIALSVTGLFSGGAVMLVASLGGDFRLQTVGEFALSVAVVIGSVAGYRRLLRQARRHRPVVPQA